MPQKKLTLTTPESRSDLSVVKLTRAEIDFTTGKIFGTIVKYDSGETESVGDSINFVMSDAVALKAIENSVVEEAQSEGALGAGTIADDS